MNKFQGAPNLTVAGQPVQGRSGGGLFSSEGYVIGVCNARDPQEQQGLFAAPAADLCRIGSRQSGLRLQVAKRQFGRDPPRGSLANAPLPGPLSAARPARPNCLPESSAAARGSHARDGHRADRQSPAACTSRRPWRRFAGVKKRGRRSSSSSARTANNDGKGDVIVVEHASHGFVKQARGRGAAARRALRKDFARASQAPQGDSRVVAAAGGPSAESGCRLTS